MSCFTTTKAAIIVNRRSSLAVHCCSGPGASTLSSQCSKTTFISSALDVHGHGQSGVRVPLILEEMAEDFHELLSRLDLREPVWVGHSIGGMLGLRIVCKHPDFFFGPRANCSIGAT